MAAASTCQVEPTLQVPSRPTEAGPTPESQVTVPRTAPPTPVCRGAREGREALQPGPAPSKAEKRTLESRETGWTRHSFGTCLLNAHFPLRCQREANGDTVPKPGVRECQSEARPGAPKTSQEPGTRLPAERSSEGGTSLGTQLPASTSSVKTRNCLENSAMKAHGQNSLKPPWAPTPDLEVPGETMQVESKTKGNQMPGRLTPGPQHQPAVRPQPPGLASWDAHLTSRRSSLTASREDSCSPGTSVLRHWGGRTASAMCWQGRSSPQAAADKVVPPGSRCPPGRKPRGRARSSW